MTMKIEVEENPTCWENFSMKNACAFTSLSWKIHLPSFSILQIK
jgi:hypothetical protein